MKTRTMTLSRDISPGLSILAWLLLTVAFITLMIPTTSVGASAVHSSARAAGMGGAFTGLAKGVDAPKYNPANLGIADYRQYGLEFVSIGVNVGNNAFTLDDYNTYTGAHLSTADKEDILNKIPCEGWNVDADVNATALTLALGSFVISTNGIGAADVNINKDVVDLILNGNAINDTITVTGSYSDALSYASLGVSYGVPIYSNGTRQLAVGATARYIKGLAAEKLVEMNGSSVTHASGIDGTGRVIVQTAEGGSGYSVDLGATLKLSNSYTAGVRVQNVLGSITWNDNPEEHGYIFDFAASTYDDFEDDDFDGSDDYTKSIDEFTTSLPTVMNAGFAKTSGKLRFAVDWIQGLKKGTGISTKPRVALGAELSLLKQLPLRAGFSTGGDRNTAFSFGSGINFFGFYFDGAVFTGTSGTLYSSKGANFALSTGLRF